MRNPLEPLFFCLVSLLCLMSVSAADLKTYSDVYQKNSEEIRQGYQPKFEGIQLQYQKSLETLKTRAQGKGDFKTTKAAFAEIERFKKAKALPPAPDESEIPEIKAFQAAYVKQYVKLESDMTANMGALATKYGQALDRLLKELTKAGKLDDAAAVEVEQAKSQRALKDFAEQLAALRGPAATNATPAVAEEKTEKGKPPEVGKGAAETQKPASKKKNPKNVVYNGDFEEVAEGAPVGWNTHTKASVITEKGNTFIRFEVNANKDGSSPGYFQFSQRGIAVPVRAKRVKVSVQMRTAITPLGVNKVPAIWTEFYNNTGDRIGKSVAQWNGKNGSWREIEREDPIPDGAVTANVTYITNWAVGQMDFDDIEMTFK